MPCRTMLNCVGGRDAPLCPARGACFNGAAMIKALFKAFAQLSDPRLRGVVLFGIFGAAAAYVALVALAWWAVSHVHWFQAAWANTASDVVVTLLALLLPLPFFPALATSVASVRLETVAEAVDRLHYPGDGPARPQGWTELLVVSLRFLAATVVVNLISLPFYVMFMVSGLTIPVAVLVNGYLLGREYFEVVAFRRMAPEEARRLFRAHRGRWWVAGAIIYVVFSVPVLNLAGPVIATAFMLHLLRILQPHDEPL